MSNKFICCMVSLVSIIYISSAYAENMDKELSATSAVSGKANVGYVAKNESVQLLLNALAAEIKKPFVLSQKANKKMITGDFDLSNPRTLLKKLGEQVGLVWYDDGTSYYVYDTSELKNAVVVLRYASLSNLNDFFMRTGLYDKRYPIRGDQKTGAFYVSGPPMYVELVSSAAAYLDDMYKNVDLSKQKIEIIRLHNTFVNDRDYDLRGEKMKVAGIASVISTILGSERSEAIELSNNKSNKKFNQDEVNLPIPPQNKKHIFNTAAGQINIVAYAETNSLLVKGTHEQVNFIQDLILQLDVPKKHIELSLWIIDISKNNLDKLGIDWQGAIDIGSKAQITLNTSGLQLNSPNSSLIDGNRFVAAISALSSKGLAQIVSRPIILAQENVPAIFDHSNTFYTKLEAERAVELDSVTYGTLINVLPRFSMEADEIEMVLNIEDGSEAAPGNGTQTNVNGMPVISRTKINTIARVPREKSLLIGGYTLDHYKKIESKVPFLGDLPFVGGLFRSSMENINTVVRMFLIQPRLLESSRGWDVQEFTAPHMLSPTLELKDAVQALRKYSETNHVGH